MKTIKLTLALLAFAICMGSCAMNPDVILFEDRKSVV